jgi:hypothetical protein
MIALDLPMQSMHCFSQPPGILQPIDDLFFLILTGSNRNKAVMKGNGNGLSTIHRSELAESMLRVLIDRSFSYMKDFAYFPC